MKPPRTHQSLAQADWITILRARTRIQWIRAWLDALREHRPVTTLWPRSPHHG